ncbi:hypothetical protein [Coleofasciculus sp. FACHB-SPT9]|uniref:hypothetical protein n=1 Tax=Cyanophyceae TaxID=3028117 RepID=UPI0018EF6CEF|nr:hypothetical protein [Coleofasciculus sp. FACHB-SPT9]
MHPAGPDSDRCLDFRPSCLVKLEFGAPNSSFTGYLDFQPSVEPPEMSVQKGMRFVNEDLVLDQPTYDGRPVPTPRQRFTPEAKLELLDYHPMFTGRCPSCEMPFERKTPPLVHWDCSQCEWVDDRV